MEEKYYFFAIRDARYLLPMAGQPSKQINNDFPSIPLQK
jgi:hypothetical protein